MLLEGPIVVMMLERDDCVRQWRDLMGSTNPDEAKEGTIRKEFGTGVSCLFVCLTNVLFCNTFFVLCEDIERNAVHGSDSAESAKRELSFFFSKDD